MWDLYADVVGSDGSAAGGGVKRPERVAAVGEGRRCLSHRGHSPGTATGTALKQLNIYAGVVELADTLDLGSNG